MIALSIYFFFLVVLLNTWTGKSFGANNIRYSIQVYTSKQQQFARHFLQNLRSDGEHKFFLYKTDNGYWTVRIYLLSKMKEALKKLDEVKKLTGINNISVVETDITKSILTLSSTEKLDEREKKTQKHFYSFQLKSSRKLKDIEIFKSKLPKNIKTKVFLYRTDNGYWTLRMYLLKSYREALKLISKIEQETGIKKVSIVRTEARKIKKLSKRKKGVRLVKSKEPVKKKLYLQKETGKPVQGC